MSTREMIKGNTITKVEPPKRYNVIILDDDVTTMDYVVEVLVVIFHKEPAEAIFLMLQVHTEGQCIAGTYSYDIAHTKMEKAKEYNKTHNAVLQYKIEEA